MKPLDHQRLAAIPGDLLFASNPRSALAFYDYCLGHFGLEPIYLRDQLSAERTRRKR